MQDLLAKSSYRVNGGLREKIMLSHERWNRDNSIGGRCCVSGLVSVEECRWVVGRCLIIATDTKSDK